MPARGSPLSAGAWCSSAFSSVPAQLPLPGCTTRPAGLSITSTSSSSCTTSSAIASARNAVSSGRGQQRHLDPLAAAQLVAGPRRSPSTSTAPSSTSLARRLRDSFGSSRASAWSRRSPASAGATRRARAVGASGLAGGIIRGFRDGIDHEAKCNGSARSSRWPSPWRAAAGWTPRRTQQKDWQAADWYKVAKEELDAGNWLAAVKLYGELESRFPFGRYAQQAQLDTAYALLQGGRRRRSRSPRSTAS